MFNLGFSEVVLIAVIALVVIGPKQLPHVAKVLGRMAGDVKRAIGDFNQEIASTAKSAEEEIKRTKAEIENVDKVEKNELKS